MKELARIRRRKGFSQRALAKESGVSPATIYELENGRRSANPSTLRKLAGALDVEVADLLEEPEQGPLDQAPPEEREPSFNDVLREDERRAQLKEIRADYRESRERLDRYCARWERRIADDDLDRRLVWEFFQAADDWSPILGDSVIGELLEIAVVFGAKEGSGLTDELKAESILYPAAERYWSLGRKLADVWKERFAETSEEAAATVTYLDQVRKVRERVERRMAG